jgi:hypothetical protein
MPSQFTIYSSGDAGGPGTMAGVAGDLIRILDAVLVNGYPGKAAAGWTQPVATSGNIACYKNASPANGGNGFGVVINDNGPNATATFKEAWATGWETVAGVGAPVGTGSGQFPTPAQLLTSGHVVIRKSNTADATGRAWVCFADSLTCYLFIADGSIANAYQAFWFGDFFSLNGSSDQYRCVIAGRAVENVGVANTTSSNMDCLGDGGSSAGTTLGLYVPRVFSGGGTSVPTMSVGSVSMSNAAAATVNVGLLQAPNGPDNAYYNPPIWVAQYGTFVLRGRYRGLYHTMHPLATFTDGQVINGAGDYAGKTFQVISKGVNNGMWIVETSATVETN